ncbi:MAG: deoxynucleoside kinase [Anaerolineales bacterium]|jgi:deoxyguanosine kinase
MYIAIDGIIGVGKTSLARLLQPVFDAELLLEAFDENPFLADFYSDRDRYAFQTQIFFLLSRYRQQQSFTAEASSDHNLIADYCFEKDMLFAHLNLSNDELATYRLVYDALIERIVQPDLIVYLKARAEIAMQRIAMRDRSYERRMDIKYLDELYAAYEAFFSDFKDVPVLTIDTNSLNYVMYPEDLSFIIKRIQSALGIPPFQPELPLDGGS